jgi:hypothetical protein
MVNADPIAFVAARPFASVEGLVAQPRNAAPRQVGLIRPLSYCRGSTIGAPSCLNTQPLLTAAVVAACNASGTC